MNELILIIEDNESIVKVLQRGLMYEGYKVESALDGEKGLKLAKQNRPDLVILDLMLPGMDGVEVCKQLRTDSNLPILMLTAKDAIQDRVLGLDAGADDYMVKPFEPRELLARVKALLRRAAPDTADDEVLVFGRLEVDLGARQARLDGRPCDLTSHQFDLLTVLARHPGRVLSRDQIMDALKGHPLDAFDRSIDVHVSRIRAVIEDDPRAPRRVLTVRGTGYVFARKQDAA